ncbi:MAG: DNA repair protein RecN [Gammaproteobacteria bacterium]|nr:DNA repair protein RecN [Gammaproteobacteria bacterium]
MLIRLHIKDLAIITTLNAEFSDGMTSLTGETGAGKSILIDALGLALGDRADTAMIRAGCDRAEITAVFLLAESGAANQWLEQQALDADGECILRRVLVREGHSRAFINGSPATLKSIQSLGEQLVDIHGQHAHQSLLRTEHQRALLDGYAGNRKLCDTVANLFQQWRQTIQARNTMRKSAEERHAKLDLLRFQIDELTQLALGPGEVDEIDLEQRRLSSAGQLRIQCARILDFLNEEEASALSQLVRANTELAEMISLEPALSDCRDMLENAAIQVEEAVSTLRNYADGIELDPQRLAQVEQRLEDIHDLARKYRCRPRELREHLASLQQEFAEIGHIDNRLEQMEQHCGELEQRYLAQSERLRKARISAAKKLEKSVSKDIRKIGMPDGKIKILVEKQPQEKRSINGLDRIAFLVSANPGQPAQPLAKVASGGELSRISLAIQVATIRCGTIPTLIFDEVDVGIGGSVAEIVGHLLSNLGEERQVLCVTHLPQVAARGHHHLLIRKRSGKNGVMAEVGGLEGSARVQEVARMLGGIDITANTLAHAKEMISLGSVNTNRISD